jgi:hypothetical protein
MIDFTGEIDKTFYSTDEFCTEIFTNKYKGYTFLAHNAKSYDVQPIQSG